MKRNGKLIPAAGYIRMSTDDQADSPKQQKSEIIKYAEKHGYRIVHWYVDEGISGSESAKRPGFLRLMRDAQETQEFEVILCWDQDRFCRFDALEANHYWYLLREAGVRIVTVAQGVLDLNDLGSWLSASVTQHGKAQYLVDLSRNVLRGKLATAKKGHWQAVPPFGYDRQYYDPSGAKVRLVAFGEKFRSIAEWRCQLVLGEPEKVDLVRWIFNEYLLKETSVWGIAKGMSERGIETPTGNPRWTCASVQHILRNPAYAGHTLFGQRTIGKYHRIGAEGEIVTKDDRSETGVVRCDNTHEAIIDTKTFATVQRKMAGRRLIRTIRNSGYPLAGLLRCGHCGGKLVGSIDRRRNMRRYRCAQGNKGWGCLTGSIPAEMLEGFLIGAVQEQILSDDHLERLRAEILATAKKRQPTRSTEAKSIKAKLAKLEAKIRKGTERLLLIDDDHAPDASRMLDEWREARVSLKSQLSGKGNGGDVRPLTPEAKAARAIDKLLALRKGIDKADCARLRYVFGKVFSEVRLLWEVRAPTKKSRGRQKRYRFSKGMAILNADDDDDHPTALMSSVNPGRCSGRRGFPASSHWER